ncbi:hypothetical protein Dimus_029650, partial [Dionaea muscipula]
GQIMKACIVLHNMIVEDERDTYTRYDDISQYDQAEGGDGSSTWEYTDDRTAEME